MEIDQYNAKLLIDYQCELSGMIYENEQRKITGKSMAYVEKDFMQLSQRYNDALNKY